MRWVAPRPWGRLHQLPETLRIRPSISPPWRPSTKPTGAALSHSPHRRIWPPQTPVFRPVRASCQGLCGGLTWKVRDLHSPLVTAHSVLFSLPRLISRFLRGNSGQGPTESSWSSSSVSVPAGRSSAPLAFPLRSVPPSLIQGTHCRWPEQSHQYPPVEPVTTPPPLPPRCPPQKSCIWQPLWPPISTAGLLSFPPPQQPIPSSAPRTHSRQRYTLIISTVFS